MNTETTPKRKNYSPLIALSSIVVILGIGLVISGFMYPRVAAVDYSEKDNAVDYEIFLKPNENYDKTSLTSDDQFAVLTNLIDRVDVNFKYSAELSEPVSGHLRYKLVGHIAASSADAGNRTQYFGRGIPLSDEQELAIDTRQHLSINEQLSINYDEYNAIYSELIKAGNGISANGTLEVTLQISGEVQPVSFSKSESIESALTLTVPLAERAVQLVANTNAKNSTKTFTEKRDEPDFSFRLRRMAGIIAFFAGIAGLVLSVPRHLLDKRKYRYDDTVDRILSSYDGIIVKSATPLTLSSDVKILKVNNFEELLDVYNSLRLPINFYRSAKTSTFVIFNDSIAWRYIIRASDYKFDDLEDGDELDEASKAEL